MGKKCGKGVGRVCEGSVGKERKVTKCGEGSVGDTSVGGMRTFPYWVVTIIGVVERVVEKGSHWEAGVSKGVDGDVGGMTGCSRSDS